MTELRVPLLLIFAGMFVSIINMIFINHFSLYVIATGILFVAAGLILSDKKKRNGYKTNWELIKGEYDIIILMFGVVLFGAKFFFPEPYQGSLHLLSLATIFLVLGFGKSVKEKTVKK